MYLFLATTAGKHPHHQQTTYERMHRTSACAFRRVRKCVWVHDRRIRARTHMRTHARHGTKAQRHKGTKAQNPAGQNAFHTHTHTHTHAGAHTQTHSPSHETVQPPDKSQAQHVRFFFFHRPATPIQAKPRGRRSIAISACCA